MKLRLLIACLFFGLMSGRAHATPLVTVSGFLDDSSNASLIGSGAFPDPPLFGNDFEIANNVALYALTLATPAAVTFDSNGFAAGGVDPYFTLFQGSSAPAATFLASNFAQAFSTGGDFLISLALAAGDYFMAIGAFANMSLAENLGIGTLGDGFIGLGEPAFLGTTYYELVVTADGSAPPSSEVPEPSSLLLLSSGIAAFTRRRKRNTDKEPV